MDVLQPIVGFTENSGRDDVAFYTGSINEDGTSPDLPNAGLTGFPDGFNGSLEWHLVNDIGELVSEHQGFTIIESSGRIALKTGTTLDYETTPPTTYASEQFQRRQRTHRRRHKCRNMGNHKRARCARANNGPRRRHRNASIRNGLAVARTQMPT